MSSLKTALRKRKLTAAKNSQAVLAGLFTLEALAKLNVRANFNQGTGDLASRWETKVDRASNTNASGHTSPLVVYARIQELGGVIHATNGPYLIFKNKNGDWIRVEAVTIPARPYLRPAAENGKMAITQSVIHVLLPTILTGK